MKNRDILSQISLRDSSLSDVSFYESSFGCKFETLTREALLSNARIIEGLLFVNKGYVIALSVALTIGLTLIATSCGSDPKPIETEPDLIAFITEIHPSQNEGISGQISVESHTDKIVQKYTVTVRTETLIFRQDGDNLHEEAFTVLETKQWVKIWFSGPVKESWPMQATAKKVVIIEPR